MRSSRIDEVEGRFRRFLLSLLLFFIFLVGEMVFHGGVFHFLYSVLLFSLFSLLCVLLVGESEESSGEIRGQRPHGRKCPPHALWG